jgi:ketosteroid isomerase-like protein
MSEENVEVVRGIYAELERGNFGAVLEVLAPDVEFVTFMPDSAREVTTNGTEELAVFMRDWFGQWERYRAIGDEFKQVGSNTVLVVGRQLGVGRGSGVEVESPGHTVWTFREGRVVRLTAHYDREQAIAAAGLSE